MIRAVLYCRYSSDSQTENSIEGQIRDCEEYTQRHNMNIVSTYIDRALSAKSDDRPEFQKMIRDSAKKQFDVVLVWKLDRFARNRLDSATYRAVLKRNGVSVVSVKESISEGPEGIILEAMLEGMAEYYSAELSVKVKRGHKENALKGKANGGTLPLGYRVNAEQYYEPDPLTAPIVQEIFQRYADGQTAPEIIEELNNRKVFIGTKYKFKNKSSIYNVLQNRKYIGEYRYTDTIIPGGMPALVTQKVFDEAQERMGKNKRRPSAMKAIEKYILTTKLFCGKCGTMAVGVSGTSRTGLSHHYYKCGKKIYKKSCDKKTAKKAQTERWIVYLTREFVLQDKVISRLADAIMDIHNQENTTIPLLQKQLADIEKRIDNLLNAIEEGMANASAKQRLDGLEAKKADLEVAIAKEKIAKTPLTKEEIVFWISRFKDGDVDDPEYRNRIVDIFVNSVFLYEDRLVIAFNWKDGTKTVTLAELEAACGGTDARGSKAKAEGIAVLSAFSGSHMGGSLPPAASRRSRDALPVCGGAFCFLLATTGSSLQVNAPPILY